MRSLTKSMLVAALMSIPQTTEEKKAVEEVIKPSAIKGTKAYRNAEKRRRKKHK